MNCYICNTELKEEMLVTIGNDLILGFCAIVIRGVQVAICSSCFRDWNKVLELLLSRFKEQKYVDEDICKKILEYKGE